MTELQADCSADVSGTLNVVPISNFDVIPGIAVYHDFSLLRILMGIDLSTCAAKCLWAPNCGAFNFNKSANGTTCCELRQAISGIKFISTYKINPYNYFYYKKCLNNGNFAAYNANFKTYYHVYGMNHATGSNAKEFCEAQGLQLIQNRNVGELQYIFNNLVPSPYHIWLNIIYNGFNPASLTWMNDGDAADFSVASPGGMRCGFTETRQCVTTSSVLNYQYCLDMCSYTYPYIVCTCYDYKTFLYN